MSDNEKQLLENTEKSCKDMIESVLCYEWSVGSSVKDCLDNELYSGYRSYLKQYVDRLGYDRVLELMEDVASKIAKIERRVYEDSEGCTYNSIKWKEA